MRASYLSCDRRFYLRCLLQHCPKNKEDAPSVSHKHLTKQLGKWLSLRALHAVIKLLKAFVVISFALLWGLWGHLGIPAGEIGRDRKSHSASGSSWAHKHNQSNDSSSQKASATFALCIFLYLMSIFRRDGIFLFGRLLGIRTQKLVWQQIVAGSWFLPVHAPFLNTFPPGQTVEICFAVLHAAHQGFRSCMVNSSDSCWVRKCKDSCCVPQIHKFTRLEIVRLHCCGGQGTRTAFHWLDLWSQCPSLWDLMIH